MTWTSLRPSIPTTIHLDDDLEARLILTHAGLSGNAAIGTLIHRFGGAAGVLELARADVADASIGVPDGTMRRIAYSSRRGEALRIVNATAQHGLKLLTPQRSGWPTRINALGLAAPLLLWLDGPETVLADDIVLVVGPRHPGREGRRATIEVATALADQGWVVAANDAPGVASLALRSAAAMNGRRLQVVPGGIGQLDGTDARTRTTRISVEIPNGVGCARTSELSRATLAAVSTRVLTIHSDGCHDSATFVRLAAQMRRPVAEA